MTDETKRAACPRCGKQVYDVHTCSPPETKRVATSHRWTEARAVNGTSADLRRGAADLRYKAAKQTRLFHGRADDRARALLAAQAEPQAAPAQDGRDLDALVEYLRWLDKTKVMTDAETPTRWIDAITALRARAERAEADAEFLRWCIDRAETYFDPASMAITGVPGRYVQFAEAVEAARPIYAAIDAMSAQGDA
jgi:ribosomal protein L37E